MILRNKKIVRKISRIILSQILKRTRVIIKIKIQPKRAFPYYNNIKKDPIKA